MKMETYRFGLPFNPRAEKKKRNKMAKHIIIFLCVFSIVSVLLALAFSILIRNYITCIAINDTIDSMWIGSIASYWGGTVGGIFSGAFAFLGVFYTIKYYKESDEQKEKSAIQPFLLVSVGAKEAPTRGFELGVSSEKSEKTAKVNVTIKNIGNGFANIMVLHTGFNVGGLAYNSVILVNGENSLFFMINPNDLDKGISFDIQYVDAMRNEYMQTYLLKKERGSTAIESGYPKFIEQI